MNESIKEAKHRWYLKNKEKILKQRKENYKGSIKYKTKEGRAYTLLQSYNHNDEMYNRGKGDITASWIVENIFTKSCVHCGESDWTKLGCNRLDNSKPHTMDNVEPCCWKCNHRLSSEEKRKPLDQINKLTGEIVSNWNSSYAAAKELGLSLNHISNVCKGQRKTCGGYIWKYIKKEEDT